jgi:hypothetical protein
VTQLDSLTAQLATDPRFAGKRLADIPPLAEVRYHFRRVAYRTANFGIAVTIFNMVLALADYPLWPLSALAAGGGAWTIWRMEQMARTMTRQLKRPAAEQVARDLLGMRD